MDLLVRAAALTNFLEVSHSLGFNPREALRRAGLTEAILKEPDRRISMTAAVNLLEESAVESGCRTFGLRMAASRKLADVGEVGLLINLQSTLRDVLATFIRYRHLINQYVAMEIEDVGKTVIVRKEILVHVPTVQATELATGVVFRTCTAVMGAQWQPFSVNFVHAAPPDLSWHRRVFHCRLEFDSKFNGIVISPTDLDAPNPSGDPALARYARQFVESLPAGCKPGIVQEVRRVAYLVLPTGRATADCVAHGLGLSVRSMQRQLNEAGVSFTSVLNDVRAELAIRYMANPSFSLLRVSELLGYSAQGAFTRWFSAQFHKAPSHWREARDLETARTNWAKETLPDVLSVPD